MCNVLVCAPLLLFYCSCVSLGQQLVQLPGGKLHVLHTQQSGGITSTSLAGNAVLKKIGDNSEKQQQLQPQQMTILQQNIDETQSIDTSRSSASVKQLVPVTKVQMAPVSNMKSPQVMLCHTLFLIL